MTEKKLGRRTLLKRAGAGVASLMVGNACGNSAAPPLKPNLVFVFADQWRAQASGYAGDPNLRTPNLDRLARESVNFRNAVSGCPVCCPYRASLITGKFPLTHGVFLNDAPLPNQERSIARVYSDAGYDTGYIGKWHLDGIDRGAFIPPERRQGFSFWRAYGCSHDYNNSYYYGNEEIRLRWEGYDAESQTREASRYIRRHASSGRPFCLFLSWGPPHAPYHTAPEEYRSRFSPGDIVLRDNVPEEYREIARNALAGYYSHIEALDDCLGSLLDTLEEKGLSRDTIFVFTSDHGDMLYSQGGQKKQQPWDESIRVPFLVRYPAVHGTEGRQVDMPINTPDIMPTLLGLSGVAIPSCVEGTDYSGLISGEMKESDNSAFICCPSPFGQWQRSRGGREYRGVRTARYTYARDLQGPWLLHDNQEDPFQLRNLCGQSEYLPLQNHLEERLSAKLQRTGDDFLPGPEYIRQWGYLVDDSGTIPYKD